jgi:hypothetical protein
VLYVREDCLELFSLRWSTLAPTERVVVGIPYATGLVALAYNGLLEDRRRQRRADVFGNVELCVVGKRERTGGKGGICMHRKVTLDYTIAPGVLLFQPSLLPLGLTTSLGNDNDDGVLGCGGRQLFESHSRAVLCGGKKSKNDWNEGYLYAANCRCNCAIHHGV